MKKKERLFSMKKYLTEAELWKIKRAEEEVL